jgi:hypothetical protein
MTPVPTHSSAESPGSVRAWAGEVVEEDSRPVRTADASSVGADPAAIVELERHAYLLGAALMPIVSKLVSVPAQTR